jgi:acyl-CoA synthetase (AMP-forming)/AMP-acid ligase II
MKDQAFPTLVHMLRARAEDGAGAGSLTFLQGGETPISMSYSELDQQARMVAVRLQELGGKGERALILAQPGLEYLAAYFGAIYAGWIPVPAYPPQPRSLERDLPRVERVIRDCTPRAVLTTWLIGQMSWSLPPLASMLARVTTLVTDELSAVDPSDWRDPRATGDDLALLQYTSGSVGEPKGVMVSHANLVANIGAIVRIGLRPGGAFVSWLPQYHDMGLIGAMFGPIYAGMPLTFMSPLDFLMKPMRWLRAMSRVRATATVAPNFAYALAARKCRDEELDDLDLSSLELVFNGAEPVRSDVMDAFCGRFSRCGFRREAFYPCYGLAESTLIAAGAARPGPPTAVRYSSDGLGRGEAIRTRERGRDLVSCGGEIGGGKIRIVDPDSRERLPERQVGEIWLQGPSVSRGYWGRDDLSRQVFRARIKDGEGDGFWLRTGDLGFVDAGMLFIVGRLKDLIIVRGVNHHPQDIELTVEEAHRSIRRGCVTAFAVETECPDEQLVIVAELERRVSDRRREHRVVDWMAEQRRVERRHADGVELLGDAAPEAAPLSMAEVLDVIARRVSVVHGVAPGWVLLVPAATVPKTPSGKLQRRATRERLLAGHLSVLAERRMST